MLTINLSGRIDANNAASVEAEISAELAEFPGEVPVFDASGLDYISSAGLRVLLKFRKQFAKNLDVLNASGEVYDIFEVTGFTELLNVRKKLREISIEGCEVIGGGNFSTVYRLDPETIVKVFTHPTATLAGAEKDQKTSREVFLHDIPTAISYDVVRVDGRYGLVYEMINADTVSGTLRKHPERLEEISLKMARLMKKLHTTEFEPDTFQDAKGILHNMIQSPFSMGMINAEDRALIDELIDRIPNRNTFIHADYHPKNVMLSNDELVLIDVGDSGLGHPIADLLISYSQFVSMPKFAAEHGSKAHQLAIGLDCNTLGAMWNIMLPEYFGTTDKDILAHYEEIISGYSSIMRLYAFSVAKDIPIEVKVKISAPVMAKFREVIGTLKPIDGI
ncbi:MAG: phosphotransferase [Synergistaceae bacterium]|nr:phosphotransferase [Synergistaceae bacterium]